MGVGSRGTLGMQGPVGGGPGGRGGMFPSLSLDGWTGGRVSDGPRARPTWVGSVWETVALRRVAQEVDTGDPSSR